MKLYILTLHIHFTYLLYYLDMHEYAYNKTIMGTEISVSVVTETEEYASSVADEAFGIITNYEHTFSRFIPTSELSCLNASGSALMSDTFLSVLHRSYELYQKTEGAFNPLVQITRHGYDADYSELTETLREQRTQPYDIDFSSVHVDEKTKRVTLQETQQLDFNGMLKGYLATKLAHELRTKYPACTGLIINLGGDLHTSGLDERGKPFQFFLYNPVTKSETPIHLTDTSLVTSGTYKRTWNTTQGKIHHILDASGTRNPDSSIIAASIMHKDGSTAEAYATLCIVKGSGGAKDIIEADKCTYWLVHSTGEVITNII